MINFTLALLAVGTTATRVTQDYDCHGNWFYEECSSSYYHTDYCRTDCGWWYLNADGDNWFEEWVTCDEFYSIEGC